MKPIAQRYVAAAVVFVLCAVWLGIGVVDALLCLAAFQAALVVADVLQRHRRRRGAELRHAQHRRRPAARPRAQVDDAESFGWPRATSG